MVIVLGADLRKDTHTFVAVDDVGRKLGEKTVRATTAGHESALRWARQQFAGELQCSSRIDELEKRITVLVEDRYPHLLAVPGCGALAAAKIAGETANANRFRSEACFAMNAGVAPLPVWSGNTRGRVRMSRTGNRQLNAALHRIAVTQIRLDSLGRVYYRKRIDSGDSTVEALRCLKRRLARTVFNALAADQQPGKIPTGLPLAA